jgi:hypothetical protein
MYLMNVRVWAKNTVADKTNLTKSITFMIPDRGNSMDVSRNNHNHIHNQSCWVSKTQSLGKSMHTIGVILRAKPHYLISVYLYNPSNTTTEITFSCLRLHVSTSGSHHQAFLRAWKLKITVVEYTWNPCVTSVGIE